MHPAIEILESNRMRNRAVLIVGLLFKAGLVLGMPMPPHAETTRSSGTISFSGAIVTGTCNVRTAGAAEAALDSLPARGECHSGDSYAGYRFSAHEVGDRPGVRLLQYAKDSYAKTQVLTYVYD